MEIIRKSIEVQGIIIEYQTITLEKHHPKEMELIQEGYWKAVEAGNTFTFIKIINYH